MDMTLIASMPCKRFDAQRKFNFDGRGGWVFSQAAADRYIGDYTNYYIVFGLAVMASDASADDYVETTQLTARMDGEKLGENALSWSKPNSMWGFHDGTAIFEWSQWVAPALTRDGLIECDIDVKLHSQTDFIRVSQPARFHVTKMRERPVRVFC